LPRPTRAILLIALLAIGLAPSRPAQAGETLSHIRKTKQLVCGVSDGAPGWSAPNAEHQTVGLAVDFCRAVAAAALPGIPTLRFPSFTAAAGIAALRASNVDLLIDNTGWTVSREADEHVLFVGPLLIDDQGVLVRRQDGITSLAGLDHRRVCAVRGTGQGAVLASRAAASETRLLVLEDQSVAAAWQTMQAGLCDGLTGGLAALASIQARAQDAGLILLPERLGQRALGPAVRYGDDQWLLLVRAVRSALLLADQQGVTQQSAAAFLAGTGSPLVADFLAQSRPIAPALDLPFNWAVAVVAASGNASEMFDRNLAAMGVARGGNRGWEQGGRLEVLPFR
jgi:general L-amino acid transport system substrate-binding protein